MNFYDPTHFLPSQTFTVFSTAASLSYSPPSSLILTHVEILNCHVPFFKSFYQVIFKKAFTKLI